MVFDKIRTLFKGGAPAEPDADADDGSLAVAALLVEAARADESYDDAERAIIDQALQARYDLPIEDARALRAKAETAQADAVDLHRFTKLAKQMSVEDKTRLVETMWRITLSDGARDQFEDALIRRICGLIYLDDRASGEARQRIEAEIARR
ncbi:MAG: TerB family tellurite resistance protein [Pseudomonadota bacterium]